MTPGVNLLPWRRRRRQRQRNVFVGQLLATAVSAAAAIGAMEFVLEGRVDDRKRRQLAVREQIRGFDERIAELDVERRGHDDLRARFQHLRQLWRDRAIAVGVLDALAQTLAVGAHYTAIAKRGNVLSVQGVAAGNDRVAQLMGNLGASHWFDEPRLQRIGNTPEAIYGSRSATFEISVAVTPPHEREVAHDAGT